MSARAAAVRVGWCPGALRPMPSGDGLIVRVKPRGGRLTREQAIGIAAAATRFGNGALDLTSRANLQIRGVCDATLADLTAALDRLGLLDASPEAEARRNVVASPLAGLDPAAAFDIRPHVEALEVRLAAEASLAGLPAKFGFAVSDGGAMPLVDGPADVIFEAERDGDDGHGFAIRLDGGGDHVAACSDAAMPAAAVRLARVFVAACRDSAHLGRMRDLVARTGAEAVFAAAGLASVRCPTRTTAAFVPPVGVLPFPVIASGATQSSRASTGRMPFPREDLLRRRSAGLRRSARNDEFADGSHADPSFNSAGHLPGGETDAFVLGVGAPFGRLDAAQLDLVARDADELRLSPWRAILVPGLDAQAAARLAGACAAAGLVVDPDDPHLRVAACPGAPGCRRGTTSTLADAARWAPLVPRGRGIALHVSGCAKGCAHPAAAALTLVGRDGRYDVVVDGRPGDAPAALGLDAAEARRLIRTTSAGAAPP